MSVFAIKILALVTMVIDHSAYYLYSSSLIGYGLYFAMRTAGRIAFPLYAFLLVNGFEKTSNRGKYLSRLVLFAAVYHSFQSGELQTLGSKRLCTPLAVVYCCPRSARCVRRVVFLRAPGHIGRLACSGVHARRRAAVRRGSVPARL